MIPPVFTYFIAILYRFNGLLLRLFITLCGGRAGKNLKCATFPVFKIAPRSNIRIGNNVALGRKVVFELTASAKIIIEDHVTIGDHARFSSMSAIVIKKYTSIAEAVVVRGSFHRTQKGTPVALQPSFTLPVHIGEDVLLGSGAIVMWGSDIPAGCIIGAHSVVTAKATLQQNGIYAGNKLRFLGERDERTEG